MLRNSYLMLGVGVLLFSLLLLVIWLLYKQKQITYLLKAEKEKLNNILVGANVGAWEWNVQTGHEEFNERWADIIGYRKEELSPISIHTWEKYCHPEDLSYAKKLLEQHFAGKSDSYACDIRMKHKNGHWVWVHTRGKVLKWSASQQPLHMFGTHQDITLRKHHEEKIYHQANYDKLTGLATRQCGDARMELTIDMAIRNQQCVGVLFIDLNKFKDVNDQYGHAVGDEVLKIVAQRIRSCIRQSDTAVRIGGDEFLVILAALKKKADVCRVANALIHDIPLPITIHNHSIVMGVSIGISIYPDDAKKPETLIKLADDAMYKIKKTGKNAYGFA